MREIILTNVPESNIIGVIVSQCTIEFERLQFWPSDVVF